MSNFREAIIDLDAVAANIRHLRTVVGTPHTMAVVKANAYGHGAVRVAAAALAAGADWLGVADIDEGLELRAAGLDAPVLSWLHGPDSDFASAIAADIDLGLSSIAQLQRVADAAAELGVTAQVQVKLETGLSRNGVHESDWESMFQLAAELQRAGLIHVRGLMSHLSNTSPDDDADANARFQRGIALAASLDLHPELIHLASTAAAIRFPAARHTMVRLGIGMYGLSPFDDASSADLGLVPVMTLRGRIASVRRVPAGAGVSYDYTWRAPEESTLALVPLGYADGVPRQASGRADVAVGERRYPIVGRIAMDQFVVNAGQNSAEVGEWAVLFGDPARGVPSASDWAEAADTVNYEIVTRIGHRVPRVFQVGNETVTNAALES